MIFGRKIKELREERGLVQRQLSAALEIDTPMYSKIERGERKAKRSQIPIMAQMFEIDEKELLTFWLADKVLDTVEGEEDVRHDALVYAQREMEAEVRVVR
jgi:transcriptional regulator with XRE-family HTH domain